jgi:Protein of unknown function (DUF664)
LARRGLVPARVSDGTDAPHGGRARQAASSADSLDQLSVSTRIESKPFTLRWVLLHVIEETARHAGQADLLREAIDGTVGE